MYSDTLNLITQILLSSHDESPFRPIVPHLPFIDFETQLIEGGVVNDNRYPI